jgi:hypothetical protein
MVVRWSAYVLAALYPQEDFWYLFMLGAELHSVARRIRETEKFNNVIGNYL